MPRRYIKRYLPNHQQVCQHKHLKILGPLIHDPNLLHLNRCSVSGAVSVGLFIAFIPVPFQMLLAAIASVFVRVNLPISVGLVWVSNPLTMPPLFYFAYKIGAWTLRAPPQHFSFELSFHWLSESLIMIWEPFLLGCLILGASSALIGSITVRALWRYSGGQLWNARKQKRKARTSTTATPQ